MANSGVIVGTGFGVAELGNAIANVIKNESGNWAKKPGCVMWSDQVLLNYVYLTSNELNRTNIKVCTQCYCIAGVDRNCIS
jgi:hypothetical protein